MYKIYNIGGTTVSGLWKWDSAPDFAKLATENYGGVYILCSHSGKDNPQLSALYDAAAAAGLRVGFYITLEDNTSLSYAKQMLNLQPWYKGSRKMGLPPAIVFTGSTKTPHVIRGDFESYFKAFFVDVFPCVVVGFNASSKAQMFDPAGEDITGFKNMMTQDKVRLWWFSYTVEPPAPLAPIIAPYKYVWIWGKAPRENWIEFTQTDITPTEPEPVDPTIVEGEPIPSALDPTIKNALVEIVKQLNIIIGKLP